MNKLEFIIENPDYANINDYIFVDAEIRIKNGFYSFVPSVFGRGYYQMHLMCNMFAPLNNEDPLHKHEYFSFDRIIDKKHLFKVLRNCLSLDFFLEPLKNLRVFVHQFEKKNNGYKIDFRFFYLKR